MAFSLGKTSIQKEDILNKISEPSIISYYLNLSKLPCVIKSPLRKDNHPSFGIFVTRENKVYFKDYATGDSGDLITLLKKIWGVNYNEVLNKLNTDIKNFNKIPNIQYSTPTSNFIINHLDYTSSELKCKIREWEKHDIEYWESYGISLNWLKYAEVYPISHKIIIKEGKKYVFKADKYAYAYVEHKEGKVTLKIYQPFNIEGYKWSNKHDSSVISLWTKIPNTGDTLCICASLKDALCLWANTNIPSIAMQGEAYKMSPTAILELKKRYKNIYILLDNDEKGLQSGEALAKLTGFKNIILPKYKNLNNPKDISDLYRNLPNKKQFKSLILTLFNL